MSLTNLPPMDQSDMDRNMRACRCDVCNARQNADGGFWRGVKVAGVEYTLCSPCARKALEVFMQAEIEADRVKNTRVRKQRRGE